MLTNISTKTIRYPQTHRVINNLSLCMLLKKSVSFIRFETQGIRNRVNVPRLKTNRSTARKTHIFGRKNLGCNMSSPPPPPGALGSNRPRQGAAEKVLKLESLRLKLLRLKTDGRKTFTIGLNSPGLSSPWSVGLGYGVPLSSVMSPALLLINFYRVNELDKGVEKGITDQSCFLVDNRL